jgi:hypothetical protein
MGVSVRSNNYWTEPLFCGLDYSSTSYPLLFMFDCQFSSGQLDTTALPKKHLKPLWSYDCLSLIILTLFAW